MTFSPTERESRDKAIRKMIETGRLQALVLIGNTSVGAGFNGDLRYYTDNRIIANRQVVAIFPKLEPVLFAGTEIQRQAAIRRSSVKDCRVIGDDFIADVAGLLKERGISKGRVGVNFEMLPTAWYLYLKQQFPQVEWVSHPARQHSCNTRNEQKNQEPIKLNNKIHTLYVSSLVSTISENETRSYSVFIGAFMRVARHSNFHPGLPPIPSST
jgi:hypothetical protein